MKIYIAGPMTGIADFNGPAFNRAQHDIEMDGHIAINPWALDNADHSGTWEEYLKRDLKYMLDCEKVHTLPGWGKSRGATLEVLVALLVGIPVFNHSTGEQRKLLPSRWIDTWAKVA